MLARAFAPVGAVASALTKFLVLRRSRPCPVQGCSGRMIFEREQALPDEDGYHERWFCTTCSKEEDTFVPYTGKLKQLVDYLRSTPAE